MTDRITLRVTTRRLTIMVAKAERSRTNTNSRLTAYCRTVIACGVVSSLQRYWLKNDRIQQITGLQLGEVYIACRWQMKPLLPSLTGVVKCAGRSVGDSETSHAVISRRDYCLSCLMTGWGVGNDIFVCVLPTHAANVHHRLLAIKFSRGVFDATWPPSVDVCDVRVLVDRSSSRQRSRSAACSRGRRFRRRQKQSVQYHHYHQHYHYQL